MKKGERERERRARENRSDWGKRERGDRLWEERGGRHSPREEEEEKRERARERLPSAPEQRGGARERLAARGADQQRAPASLEESE
eukprot:scaffold123816_cov34-Tisochrysis_lutea.AAC.6